MAIRPGLGVGASIVVSIVAGAVLTGAPQAAADGPVRLIEIAQFDGFSDGVVAAPGDQHRLFVVEQTGRVWVVLDGVKQAQPFLDFRTDPDFESVGESGLLSLAFGLDYATSGLLYTLSTTRTGAVRVHELHRSLDPGLADPSSKRLVLQVDHGPLANHFGGELQFGPDGYLYVSTGDGGGGNDPGENAENLGVLMGKLLRIDPRPTASTAYRIPPDNPFAGVTGARPEIFAYGLRNPWRFSFDRATGDLVIADVGQGMWEEVDYLLRGTGAGTFFGWDMFEGFEPLEPGTAGPHTPPVLVRSHVDGDCSIIGGYVVRDPNLESLFGRYLHTDLCTGDVRSGVLSLSGVTDDASTGLSAVVPVSFGEDLAGCLYLVTINPGRLYRIADSDNAPVPCVDGTAPETSIVIAPPHDTASSSAHFAFAANETAALFRCRIDGASEAPCGPDLTLTDLTEGSHVLDVRAIDSSGHADNSPASYAWRIDVTAPAVAIASAPSSLVASSSASFSFAASDSTGFECRVDGASFSACSSPIVFSGLGDGGHSFSVRAHDAVGNVGGSASATWVIDTSPPETVLISGPRPTSSSTNASIAFASDAGVTFNCTLDRAALAPCVSPVNVTGSREGDHVLEVTATDAAGNVEPGALVVQWRVNFAPLRATDGARLLDRLAALLAKRRHAFARTGAIAVPSTPSASGVLVLVVRTAARPGRVVGSGSRVAGKGRAMTLRLELTASGRALLGQRKPLVLALRVVFTGPGRANAASSSRRVTLPR